MKYNKWIDYLSLYHLMKYHTKDEIMKYINNDEDLNENEKVVCRDILSALPD